MLKKTSGTCYYIFSNTTKLYEALHVGFSYKFISFHPFNFVEIVPCIKKCGVFFLIWTMILQRYLGFLLDDCLMTYLSTHCIFSQH